MLVKKKIERFQSEKLELETLLLKAKQDLIDLNQKVKDLEKILTVSKKREANCLDFLSHQINQPSFDRKELIERAIECLVGL